MSNIIIILRVEGTCIVHGVYVCGYNDFHETVVGIERKTFKWIWQRDDPEEGECKNYYSIFIIHIYVIIIVIVSPADCKHFGLLFIVHIYRSGKTHLVHVYIYGTRVYVCVCIYFYGRPTRDELYLIRMIYKRGIYSCCILYTYSTAVNCRDIEDIRFPIANPFCLTSSAYIPPPLPLQYLHPYTFILCPPPTHQAKLAVPELRIIAWTRGASLNWNKTVSKARVYNIVRYAKSEPKTNFECFLRNNKNIGIMIRNRLLRIRRL